MKAALLAKHFLSASLDAPDSEKRFDVNEGFVDVGHAVRALTASMPNGARTILERLVSCQALSEYQRGQTLIAYSEALGDETRPVVFRELKQTILRQYAAQAIEKLGKDRDDPELITALQDALLGEKRTDVLTAVAKALMANGPAGRAHVKLVLDACEPWTRCKFAWRLDGGTDRALADLLTEAGVMDPVTDEQLANAAGTSSDPRSLIWAGGERLLCFNVKASQGLEHYSLFQGLLKMTRPVVAVDDLAEICDANLRREPVPDKPAIRKVTDLGTVCTIRFQYQGRAFSFEAFPQGRWHDVAAVMKGFDTFMRSIDRDDRCYELEGGGGEWALLVVAPVSKFGPLSARLGIPLVHDSASERDAAKAYQRQIQDMHRADSPK